MIFVIIWLFGVFVSFTALCVVYNVHAMSMEDQESFENSSKRPLTKLNDVV